MNKFIILLNTHVLLYLNILVFYVVGNKSDLYTNAVVSDEEGRSFALEINGLFRIISCKTGEGIKEMFDEIGRIIKSEKNQKEQSRISLDKTVKTNAGCCGSKRETKSTCRRTKKSEYCSFNRRTDSIVGETLPQSILIPANNKSLKKQKTNTNTTISSHDVTPMNIPISDSEEKNVKPINISNSEIKIPKKDKKCCCFSCYYHCCLSCLCCCHKDNDDENYSLI